MPGIRIGGKSSGVANQQTTGKKRKSDAVDVNLGAKKLKVAVVDVEPKKSKGFLSSLRSALGMKPKEIKGLKERCAAVVDTVDPDKKTKDGVDLYGKKTTEQLKSYNEHAEVVAQSRKAVGKVLADLHDPNARMSSEGVTTSIDTLYQTCEALHFGPDVLESLRNAARGVEAQLKTDKEFVAGFQETLETKKTVLQAAEDDLSSFRQKIEQAAGEDQIDEMRAAISEILEDRFVEKFSRINERKGKKGKIETERQLKEGELAKLRDDLSDYANKRDTNLKKLEKQKKAQRKAQGLLSQIDALSEATGNPKTLSAVEKKEMKSNMEMIVDNIIEAGGKVEGAKKEITNYRKELKELKKAAQEALDNAKENKAKTQQEIAKLKRDMLKHKLSWLGDTIAAKRALSEFEKDVAVKSKELEKKAELQEKELRPVVKVKVPKRIPFKKLWQQEKEAYKADLKQRDVSSVQQNNVNTAEEAKEMTPRPVPTRPAPPVPNRPAPPIPSARGEKRSAPDEMHEMESPLKRGRQDEPVAPLTLDAAADTSKRTVKRARRTVQSARPTTPPPPPPKSDVVPSTDPAHSQQAGVTLDDLSEAAFNYFEGGRKNMKDVYEGAYPQEVKDQYTKDLEVDFKNELSKAGFSGNSNELDAVAAEIVKVQGKNKDLIKAILSRFIS